MSVRMVTAVAVECDHRDDEAVLCSSVLWLRATDPGVIDQQQVFIAAADRGWDTTTDRQHCPKHRRTTTGAES